MAPNTESECRSTNNTLLHFGSYSVIGQKMEITTHVCIIIFNFLIKVSPFGPFCVSAICYMYPHCLLLGCFLQGGPSPHRLSEFYFVSISFFHMFLFKYLLFSGSFFLEHKAALTWWTCTQYILWWEMSLCRRRDWTIQCRIIARAATSAVPSCAPTPKVLPGGNMWTLPSVMLTQSKERPFSIFVLLDLKIDDLLCFQCVFQNDSQCWGITSSFYIGTSVQTLIL